VSTIAAISEVKKAQPVKRVPPQAEDATIRELLTATIVKNVPEDCRALYKEHLFQRLGAFSADTMDIGRTDKVEMYLDLSDKEPVYTPQFRLPMEQLELIKQNVAGWLRAGIIQKSDSPYNSPIFCVPKKAGHGMRCVLDYRRLNDRTVSSKYSIRTIDQCIEEVGLAMSKVFSCLDMTNGFWQQSLREGDRPYTSFTIPGQGQFQWTVTAQGLQGAPAAFSRLMDEIMVGARNVITYIDDVLIHSPNHTEHVEHMCEAIDRVSNAGLMLNAKKCIFGASSVEYLGHTIAHDGTRPGLDKTKALAEMKVPTTMKQLKSFIGLANYFRPYIKNFSRIANDLHALTRKGSGWQEGSLPVRATAAYETLKAGITSRPVMQYPQRLGQYHLFVDAALGDGTDEGGLGAALFQESAGSVSDGSDGHKRPVGYASRRLKTHEKNYPAFIAEMQAAVFGMEQFKHYLIGRKFYLYTDHKPLCRLSTVHSRTLNRLQLKMNEMHPDIRYIEGKNNTVADFLSRYQGLG
jgi:hypothetical protein